ncbi:Calcium-transporting ATPase 1 [Vitis vinifera]|uniref:Calcium-transporting ATPase 1 n=1 Tax=Vitis vinifera TaxID=29760 RepID=A0A438KN84_VITVI|nr:Calcium-transporting ATPase 1 [Vitis vinifera]
MESYLNDNFGGVKPKNSSEEALQRWRKLCWVVKNPKRRFRFTANLSKRFEAQAIRRSNQGGRSWNCECCELPRLLLAIGF